MSFSRSSTVGISLLGLTNCGFGNPTGLWESDRPEIATAVQRRIDQQLPWQYRQAGLVGDLSEYPYQHRYWDDLCGVDQLYADIRHYIGPQLETWKSLAFPVCQSSAQEWNSVSTFVLLTRPLRSTFTDDPVGPSVSTQRLTVQKDLWRPVIAGIIQRQITVDG